MKLSAQGRATLAQLRAVFGGNRRKRSLKSAVENTRVGEGATVAGTPPERESGVTLLAKALLAIAGVAITLAGLALSHKDSKLERLDGGGGPSEFGDYKTFDESLTMVLVLNEIFTNAGLESDYIDRVDIHPANLDKVMRGEAKFIDRSPIRWREKKKLRFELLVTTSLATYDWQNFLVTFYDSRGCQVGQTAVTARFLRPGDIQPKRRRMLTLTDGVSDKAPPPRVPLPTLVGVSLTASLPKAYRHRNCRLFARVLSTEGVVAGTNSDGERESNGKFVSQLMVTGHANKMTPLRYMISLTPPDVSQPIGAGFRVSVSWTLKWSDGTEQHHSAEHVPTPENLPAPTGHE